jgi:hypothetical protein
MFQHFKANIDFLFAPVEQQQLTTMLPRDAQIDIIRKKAANSIKPADIRILSSRRKIEINHR